MDEAQEKAMDSVACFKRGALLSITGQQYNVCSKNLKRNLLVSSNRYGYVFYGTETDGLAIIPSAYIDHQSRRHVLPSDDDGGDNVHVENASIIHRSYLPGQTAKQNTSLIPYWLSLNADETILAIILFQTDAQASHLIFYDVAQYIQKPDAPPICPVMRLTSDIIGDSIRHFAWNPVIPNIFAYIDGLGSVSTFAIDKQMKTLGKSNADTNNSSICWSPKGKQIVVVKYDGSLEFFDENMQPKKKNSSVVSNQSFPPCINILWVSTHQFLLGFSTTNSNSDPNALSHVMATYSKDHPPKAQIFYDFFFDVTDMSTNTNLQYYYTSMNQNKIVMCGLSKSMKTNVIGADELNSNNSKVYY
ncbi:unnamed protein product [Adineta ricciae]|uniref:Nucleoporin Nup159/Nup146 N-terminal domain-containing protein n=1 Tax=Adineta ricciae TaxID=249248 RepID=A0A814HKY7_ADIRI|nr:unnamed protein product [Adineta ricciae]